jgi:TrmH family RNA methyltransferase
MLFSFFNDSFRFRLNSIHHRIHLYSSNPFNHQQIISESNNKIKLMKSLDNIKGREKLSCVRLEGHRQIIDAVQNGLNPKIILYTFRSIDEAIKGNKIHQELYQILKSCQPDIVNEVTEPLMQSISNTVTNQGVIAAFDKPSPIKTIPFSRSQIPSLILVLDGISDPGNLGTIIRYP